MMLARPEDLPNMPAGVRRYVEDWFKPCEVFGKAMLFAAPRLHLDHTDYVYRGKQPGFAPCHSVDTREYGLDDDTKRWICRLYPPYERQQNVIDCD
jgi:hypothetical protein